MFIFFYIHLCDVPINVWAYSAKMGVFEPGFESEINQ